MADTTFSQPRCQESRNKIRVMQIESKLVVRPSESIRADRVYDSKPCQRSHGQRSVKPRPNPPLDWLASLTPGMSAVVSLMEELGDNHVAPSLLQLVSLTPAKVISHACSLLVPMNQEWRAFSRSRRQEKQSQKLIAKF